MIIKRRKENVECGGKNAANRRTLSWMCLTFNNVEKNVSAIIPIDSYVILYKRYRVLKKETTLVTF